KLRSPFVNVYVLILTLNEEVNLPRALECLGWCSDIVVVDSGSTDSTLDIAREAGCRIYEHPFENWASQGDWAMKKVEYKHPWVYYMDADEILPPELITEIEQATSQNDE